MRGRLAALIGVGIRRRAHANMWSCHIARAPLPRRSARQSSSTEGLPARCMIAVPRERENVPPGALSSIIISLHGLAFLSRRHWVNDGSRYFWKTYVSRSANTVNDPPAMVPVTVELSEVVRSVSAFPLRV